MATEIDTRPASTMLVTGGTGTLGRHVVSALRQSGRAVRVLSRGRHSHEAVPSVEFVTADLATGQGIERALEGIEVIVHCAGSAKGDEDKARQLVRAAGQANVRHLVYISVVGDERIPVASRADQVMFGYFASKLAACRIVADSGVPWTTLHATQFYDAILATARGMAKLPLVPVPAGFRFQPVDAREVAARLVELALGAPAGLVPDIAGPRVYEMADLIRSYLAATHKRRLIVSMPMPGGAARAIRGGANLAPDRAVGRRTWEEFLAEALGHPADGLLATAKPR